MRKRDQSSEPPARQRLRASGASGELIMRRRTSYRPHHSLIMVRRGRALDLISLTETLPLLPHVLLLKEQKKPLGHALPNWLSLMMHLMGRKRKHSRSTTHGSVSEGTRRQQSWSCRPPPPAATVGHSAAWTVVCPHFALVVPLVPMRLTSSSLLSGTASFWSTTSSGLYGWNGHSPIAATDTLPRLAAHSFS